MLSQIADVSSMGALSKHNQQGSEPLQAGYANRQKKWSLHPGRVEKRLGWQPQRHSADLCVLLQTADAVTTPLRWPPA